MEIWVSETNRTEWTLNISTKKSHYMLWFKGVSKKKLVEQFWLELKSSTMWKIRQIKRTIRSECETHFFYLVNVDFNSTRSFQSSIYWFQIIILAGFTAWFFPSHSRIWEHCSKSTESMIQFRIRSLFICKAIFDLLLFLSRLL